jgi:putative transposase
MRAYKFRIYPSKKQEELMRTHIWRAKELWNELLSHTKTMYCDFGRFPTKSSLQLMVKNAGLFSQTQQEISHRIHNSIKRFMEMKKVNKRCGFPRFKNFDRMKSLYYPQAGFRLGDKLKVTPFGEISIKKHREIDGKVKTLSLKKESSGKWYAVFTVEEPKHEQAQNHGGKVGIDLGLKTIATFSDGRKVDNPRHFNKWQEKLAFAQLQLSEKQNGGRNRYKQKHRVAVIYEKIKNSRTDFLHKLSRQLVTSYSLIALEKLGSQKMAEQNYGKSINDAGWGMFANMLAYKAESAGCKIVFVDPKNTTKECSKCGVLTPKTLWERTHNCPACGLVLDRDVNAAINILNRATAGQAGSNACGDGANGSV